MTHSGDTVVVGAVTTPPVLDGVLSPGEWATAGTLTFPISNSLGPATATLYVTHDDTSLYVAIDARDSSTFPCSLDPFCAIRPVPGHLNTFAIYFDDNHNGVIDAGEDAFIAALVNLWGDQFWDQSLSYTPKWNGDTADGGTPDGAAFGAVDEAKGTVTFEFRHPLCSSDTAHDICLTSGSTAGFTVAYQSGDGSVSYFPTYPSFDAGAYGDVAMPRVVTTVSIDIKPGSNTNPINLSSSGLIPVAILTTDSFDATTVDPGTVCFGDDDNPGQRDCTEADGKGHIEDVNADGRPDLLLHYEVNQTGIDPGDSTACLSGETFASVKIEGCDSITTL